MNFHEDTFATQIHPEETADCSLYEMQMEVEEYLKAHPEEIQKDLINGLLNQIEKHQTARDSAVLFSRFKCF